MWFLNPFAWQALFLLGAWFGWRNIHGGVSWLGRRWLFWLAAALSLAGFLIRFSWTLHGFYDPIPVLVSAKLLWPFLSKTDLGLLRFVNVLAVALLVASLIRTQARFLASPAAWPFVICGRNSLHIFCLGILLSVLGHLVLNEFFGGIPMQFAVSAAGVVDHDRRRRADGVVRCRTGHARWRRRWGADGEQRSREDDRCLSSSFAIVLIAAMAVGLLITVVGAFAEERECPVPERFYAFEPLLTKTAKALAGGREVVIVVLGGASTMGARGGRARIRLARASGLGARREISVCAHQGDQPRRRTRRRRSGRSSAWSATSFP